MRKNPSLSFPRLLLTLLLLAAMVSSHSQTQKKKDLEQKKQELMKEIEQQNKVLNEVKKNKNRSMVQLAILNNKISKQKELIAAINGELEVIESGISETRQGISSRETELRQLKADYARIVISSYMNRDSYARLMFLFASQDFNQALMRLRFMQFYNEARQKQAGLIDDARRQLTARQQELESRKEEQSRTLAEKQQETGHLTHEKKNKESLLSDLQRREKDIRSEIKRKKEQAEKLRKAIEKVVSDQIRKSQGSSPGAASAKKIVLTPEEKELSDNFESNKGKLPWPLAEGVITEEFGTHDHPDMPGIKITNNGVNIGTRKGAQVRAVFGGTVVAVASVGGLEGRVVIIKHGEYLSVYSNLEEAYVKQGDKVKTKQSIGRVLTDEQSNTELHFEIWKGQSMLNPESWITRLN